MCGGATAAEATFCQTCGTRLGDPQVACGACGNLNQPNAHFCTSCGVGLAAAPQVASATQPASPYVAAAPPPVSPPPVSPPPVSPASPYVAAAPPPVSPAPAFAEVSTTNSLPVRPVSLLGAAVAIGGALLGWFSTFGASANSFDIALLFLIDYQTTASNDLSIGLLVVLLAAVAAVIALIPSTGSRSGAIQFLGGLLIVVAAAFLVQVILATNNTGISFIDVIGIGPVLTAAGGIALVAGK